MVGLSGAGGNWQVIDEIADRTVVQQQDKLSCGPACGEMLLGDRGVYGANQSLIAAETGVPVNIEDLAIALNTLDTSSSRFWLVRIFKLLEPSSSLLIKTMKVQVLSIQSAIAPNTHEVLLSVGTDTQKFIFTTEVNRVGEHLLQTTHGDSLRDSCASRTFSGIFKFNQRVAMNVTNLVVKCYNRETVNLPADVGVFVTPEIALSKQKRFENNGLADTESQQTTAVDREIRQRAIAILEQLPEAVLDEAVRFLESLYVKGDRLQ